MPNQTSYIFASEQLNRFIEDAVAAKMAGRARRVDLGTDFVRTLVVIVADELEERQRVGPPKEEETT